MSCSDLSPARADEEPLPAAEPFTVQDKKTTVLADSSGRNVLPDSLSRPFEGVFLKEKEKFTARQQVSELSVRRDEMPNRQASQAGGTVFGLPIEALQTQSSCIFQEAQICYDSGDPEAPFSCTIISWQECPDSGGGGDGSGSGDGDEDPPCTFCDNDGDGGGGGGSSPPGGGGSPECDDPNAIFTPAECEEEPADPPEEDPDMPCVGNPIKNPEVAPQTNSGIDGGRFGEDARVTEDGGPLAHNGLDLKNSLNDNVYNMYDGEVYATGFNKGGWGNFIIIKSNLGGSPKFFLYAHLESFEVLNGDNVTAGAVLGIAGESGNLKRAKKQNLTIQHLHIEVRDAAAGVVFNQAQKLNPESFVTTKFDENGQVISGTEC